MVDAAELRRAAGILREGGLVAFPTETVYGLGANALDAAAVERIYRAKGRPKQSPLIVHVASVAMARALARVWPPAAERLAQRFWPGPLTLVVEKSPRVPDVVTAGLGTVGLRCPKHPVARALIEEAGVPLAGPSANRFGETSPTRAEHVRRSLGDAVDLILDGGPCEVGIESTVVSLAGEPVLLRPGAISRKELEEACGCPIAVRGAARPDSPHPSPGLHPRHYSPRTPVWLVAGEAPLPPGRGAWLWLRTPRAAERAIRMPDNPLHYGQLLYKTFHDLDVLGLDWIAVEPPPEDSRWEAVADRLTRASYR